MMCVGITCVLFVQAEYKCCSLMCALIDGIRFMVLCTHSSHHLACTTSKFQTRTRRQAKQNKQRFEVLGIWNFEQPRPF